MGGLVSINMDYDKKKKRRKIKKKKSKIRFKKGKYYAASWKIILKTS